MTNNNKVKYGLENVYYAVGEIQQDGTATYQAPVRWPGAVSLSLEAQGDITKFRADDIDYWVGQSNNGYEGDFESAMIPESFRKDVLGEVEDANGAIVEVSDAPTVIFALIFQFLGDKHGTRHVMYNCTASRPSVEGETTGETTEPKTETATITASTIWNNSLQKNIVKARVGKDDAAYNTWFEQVYIPGSTLPQPQRTITLNLTGVTSSNDATTVTNGESYTTTLTEETSLTMGDVTVTMGGTNITSTAYDTSSQTVTISEVAGDIVITAEAS